MEAGRGSLNRILQMEKHKRHIVVARMLEKVNGKT